MAAYDHFYLSCGQSSWLDDHYILRAFDYSIYGSTADSEVRENTNLQQCSHPNNKLKQVPILSNFALPLQFRVKVGVIVARISNQVRKLSGFYYELSSFCPI